MKDSFALHPVNWMEIFINRGAQNVASVVARWCLWRVQRGPSGPVDYCVICIMPLLFGFIVFLQQNPAIKLLCNEGGRET